MGKNTMQVKRVISIIMSIVFMFSYAVPDEELFLNGCQAYENGDYQQARSYYESMGNKGYAAWYNLSCCFNKLGDSVQELICLYCAQRQSPSFKSYCWVNDAIHNQEKKLGKKEHESWFDSFGLFVGYIKHTLSTWVYQIIWLGTSYTFWGSWMLCKKTGLYKIVLVPLGIMLLLITIGLILKYRSSMYQEGIMLENNAVHTGPNPDFHTFASLDSGDHLYVLDECDQWHKVQKGSCVGWVPKNVVALIT